MKEPWRENHVAYERLMAQYRSSIEQECAAYQSLQSAELSHSDLVQEVALRVWERISQFKGLDHEGDTQLRNLRFEAWLRKTTRSTLNNLYRDRKTLKRKADKEVQHLTVENDAVSNASSASSVVQREEERTRVRTALHKCLDNTLRSIVILHIHQNHTFAEIAENLGLTYDQVRHKYRSALKLIENELES